MKYILIRGGGDLASGVALRLHHSGFNIIIAELPHPLAVRRTVSFSEAIYDGEIVVEGLCARRANSLNEAFDIVRLGHIPVVIDPLASILHEASWKQPHDRNDGYFSALIDARLLKYKADTSILSAPLVIGLGPGFTCGENCHAVVETQRGHFLGRVYWSGSASADTGQPEGDSRRVLRAPVDGILTIPYAQHSDTRFAAPQKPGSASKQIESGDTQKQIAQHPVGVESYSLQIGDHVESGQVIAEVGGEKITAPFEGVLRGLLRPGAAVQKGVKIGDIDPRNDSSYCFTCSDKALSIAGGVLEALLTV